MGKLKLTVDDFSFEDNSIKAENAEKKENTETKKETPKKETVIEKKEEPAAAKTIEKEENKPAEAVKATVSESAKEETEAEEKTVKSSRGRKARTKSTIADSAAGADFLQIDIRGMRDYLSTITSYEAMKTGDKVSFNTYIRNLIEKDMKKNAELYRKFKEMMANF